MLEYGWRMWIYATRNFPNELDEKITALIGSRVDREDASWINLDTGARVVLAANGGWRDPEGSAYHAVHVSPDGSVTDVSYGLLGGLVSFDTSATGSDTFTHRRQAAFEYIESVLNVFKSDFRR